MPKEETASTRTTGEEYTSRLAAYVKGRDPIAMQHETPGILARLIEGVSSERLKKEPAPGKWSVCAILAHLAEDEIASAWRYRQMLEHDGCPLPGYGQELWAKLGSYPDRDPQESLQLFRLLRKTNLNMFDNLSPKDWKRHGVHAERGEMTVRDLAVQIAGHDINHIAQLKVALHKS